MRQNELVWLREMLMGLVLVGPRDGRGPHKDATNMQMRSVQVPDPKGNQITQKWNKRPPLLACLCCSLCEFVSRLRRKGVWLQCVLVWGRREEGREEKTSRRVYHQVRVRRERQAERTVWSAVRETVEGAAIKRMWSLLWIHNTC